MRTRTRAATFTAAFLAFGLIASACGSDSDSAGGATTTAAEATTAAPESSAAEGSSTEAAAPSTEAPAAEPAEMFDLTIATTPSFPALPQIVGIDEGIFAKHGLNITGAAVAAGPDMGAAQIAGEIIFAGNIPNNQIGLINAGFDVVAVLEQVSAQFFDILVSTKYGLGGATEWQDVMKALEGANVGVVANGAAAEDIARTLFSEAGVDADAQTYIATGLPDTTLAAMTNGEIDMAITFDPGFVIAEAQGIGTQPFSLREGQGPEKLLWPSLLVTASRDWVAEHPDVTKAYNEAVLESIAFIQDPANRDRMIEIMGTSMSLDPELAAAMLDANAKYFSTTGAFDTAALDRAAAWVNEIGKSPKLLTTADFTVTVD